MAEINLNDLQALNNMEAFLNNVNSQDTGKAVDENEDLKEIIKELETWNPIFSFSEISYLTVRRCLKNEDLNGLAGIMMKFAQHILNERKKNASIRESFIYMQDEKDRINNFYREALAENRKLRLEVSGSGNNIGSAQDVIDWRDKFEKLNTEYRKVLSENEKLRLEDKRSVEMKSLYESGWSLRKIGKKFGCDKSTVKRKLEKLGVEIRRK